jgi:hypothetical protein
MQRPDPSSDRSSAIAFVAFAAAATVWIGIMAVQPKPERLQASVIIMSKDIAMTIPRPAWAELADLSR